MPTVGFEMKFDSASGQPKPSGSRLSRPTIFSTSTSTRSDDATRAVTRHARSLQDRCYRDGATPVRCRRGLVSRSARTCVSSGPRQVRETEISNLDLGCHQRLPIDEGNDGSQQQIDEQNKSRCHRRVRRVAGAGQNPDGGRAPDSGGGIESAYARTFAEDQAGAEKPDTGHQRH